MNFKNLPRLGAALCLCALPLLAQDTASAPPAEFMLIIRSKADFHAPLDQVQTNIKHWQAFMGNLARNGQLAGGYRPANDGVTLTGTAKTEKAGSYVANDDVVSSFLIIKAGDLGKAREIASACPVFELGGSVEIRPLQDTAH